MSNLTPDQINQHFGDMDLYLIDAILKGHIPSVGKVLDIGCGEGRNGIFFIQQGYAYHGIDSDNSKLRLIEYVAKSVAKIEATFALKRFESTDFQGEFDLVIASRVLHFCPDRKDFFAFWEKIITALKPGGIVYFSMDSAVVSSEVLVREKGQFEFADGRVSLALTDELYTKMKQGCDELEVLKTLVYRKARAQSFGLLRKQ
ncbi:MAG: class I SAM-dependent methyltransferase [Bacteroidota bacterium]